MIGVQRLENLRQLTEAIINQGIPGDLIETGVWRGGACILMRGILAAYGVRDRTVFVADSFAGLPAPDSHNYPADQLSDLHTFSQLTVSRNDVASNFAAYDLLDVQVMFVEGWFKDTLNKFSEDQKFALIRLDGDLYELTMQALEALYPRLSEGGFCIIDDYGALDFCAKAVEDYRDKYGISAPLQQIDRQGRWWRKDW